MTHARSDAELATRLAVEAGQLLVQVRAGADRPAAHPRGRSWTRATSPATASCSTSCTAARPDDAVLSEEGVEDPRRFTADRVWIVDPLDGTNEFGEHGRHDWAVHVALWDRRSARRRRGQPAGARPRVRHRPAHRCCRRSSASVRGWSPAAPATRPAAVIVANALGCRRRAPRLGRREGDGGRGGRGRHLRARRRHVPVGQRRAGRGRAGRRPARQPHRRLAARLQRPRPLAARLPRLPQGATPSGVLDGAVGRSPGPGRERSVAGVELTAIRYEVDGHVATVWLHRPHRHNAWTGRMHSEYRRVLAELDADPTVRVVVVTGTPPAFCVGGDSDALAGHAERGAYDAGLADELPTPGLRRAPGVRRRLRVPVRDCASPSSPPSTAPRPAWAWHSRCSATCGSAAPRPSSPLRHRSWACPPSTA